jgi:uncharacterized protein (DUF1330 family)
MSGSDNRRPQMPKGYWIGHVDVSDVEGFKAYQRANQPIFAK